jgi:hypothetical protein
MSTGTATFSRTDRGTTGLVGEVWVVVAGGTAWVDEPVEVEPVRVPLVAPLDPPHPAQTAAASSTAARAARALT